MYTGYIVKAGEICKDERVAKAIKNFKYENETVLCVGQEGYITGINTLQTANSFVGEQSSPEAYLAAYLEKLNSPAEEGGGEVVQPGTSELDMAKAALHELGVETEETV